MSSTPPPAPTSDDSSPTDVDKIRAFSPPSPLPDFSFLSSLPPPYPNPAPLSLLGFDSAYLATISLSSTNANANSDDSLLRPYQNLLPSSLLPSLPTERTLLLQCILYSLKLSILSKNFRFSDEANILILQFHRECQHRLTDLEAAEVVNLLIRVLLDSKFPLRMKISSYARTIVKIYYHHDVSGRGGRRGLPGVKLSVSDFRKICQLGIPKSRSVFQPISVPSSSLLVSLAHCLSLQMTSLQRREIWDTVFLSGFCPHQKENVMVRCGIVVTLLGTLRFRDSIQLEEVTSRWNFVESRQWDAAWLYLVAGLSGDCGGRGAYLWKEDILDMLFVRILRMFELPVNRWHERLGSVCSVVREASGGLIESMGEVEDEDIAEFVDGPGSDGNDGRAGAFFKVEHRPTISCGKGQHPNGTALFDLRKDLPHTMGRLMGFLLADEPKMIKRIKLLFRSLRPFCHPDRSEDCVETISAFLLRFMLTVARRTRFEKMNPDECGPLDLEEEEEEEGEEGEGERDVYVGPPQFPLSEKAIDIAVQLVLPCALDLARSSDDGPGHDAVQILKHLSFLRPDMLVEPIIKLVKDTVRNRIHEAHMLSEIMTVLSRVIIPLMVAKDVPVRGNSSGATVRDRMIETLPMILDLGIEGLSPSAPARTYNTCAFFLALFLVVPMFGLEEWEEWKAKEEAKGRIVKDLPPLGRGFEDFASKFIDCVLKILEFEGSDDGSIGELVPIFLDSLSDRMLANLWETKIRPFLFGPTLLVKNHQDVGTVVSVVCSTTPELLLGCTEVLVEKLCVREGDDDALKLRDLSEDEHGYYFSILSAVCMTPFTVHLDCVVQILRAAWNSVLTVDSRTKLEKISESTARLIGSFMQCLTEPFFDRDHHSRLFERADWEKNWGRLWTVAELVKQRDLFTLPPIAKERREIFVSIFNEFVPQAMSKIREFVDTPPAGVPPEQYSSALVCLATFFDSGGLWIAHVEEGHMPEYDADPFVRTLNIHCGDWNPLPNERLDATRLDYANLLVDVCSACLEKEDAPIELQLGLLYNLEVCFPLYDDCIESIGQMRSATRSMIYSAYPRKRADTLYNIGTLLKYMSSARIALVCPRFCEVHLRILKIILRYAVSPYRSIRIEARRACSQMVTCFGDKLVEDHVLPWCLELLGKENATDEEIRGAVNIIDIELCLRLIRGSYGYLSKFLVAFCRCHPKKDSTKDLINGVYDLVFSHMKPIPWIEEDLNPIDGEEGKLPQLPSSEEHAIMMASFRDLLLESLPWKQQWLVISFVLIVIRQDRVGMVPGDLARVMANYCTSDVRLVRDAAMIVLTVVFEQYKSRTKKRVVEFDNLRLSELIEKPPPTDAETWNQTTFVDLVEFGWDKVTNIVVREGPMEESEEFMKAKETFLSEVGSLVLSETWFPKVLDIFRRQEVVAIAFSGLFFKGLFLLFPDLFDRIAQPALQVVLDTSLGDSTNCVDEKSSVNAILAIVVGFSRSLVHRSYEYRTSGFEFVRDCIARIMDGCSLESSESLVGALQEIVRNRDERRMRWLHEFLLSRLDFSAPSASLTRVLNLIASVWFCSCWREAVFTRLFPVLLENVAHPYQSVRTAVAGLLALYVVYSWRPNRDPETFIPISTDERDESSLNGVLSKIREYHDRVVAGDDRRLFERVCKAICNFTASVAGRSSIVAPCVVSLFDLLSLMASTVSDDVDFQTQSRQAFSILAKSLFPKAIARGIMNELQVLNSLSQKRWGFKGHVIAFFESFAFAHMFHLNLGLTHIGEIQDETTVIGFLFRSLRDATVEVRRIAMRSLSGFLSISSAGSQENLARHFMHLARAQLHAVRKWKRRHQVESDAQFPIEEGEAHFVVLGLSALVHAFPDSLPPFLPSILVLLASSVHLLPKHNHGINKTIADAYAAFWRTHKNEWSSKFKLAFSEDDLSTVLQFCGAPNYYI